MGYTKKYRCDNCLWRKKAETNPKTFLAWLWRIHTKICPRWKAYQQSMLDGS